ncbi:hypothetical protein OE903_23195 [Bacillus sp. B6(2022)]|nr:hypothetical protein [Bacillus sp. B6(2022)]
MAKQRDILEYSDTFRYQLLSRLQSDCRYYLGNGDRNKKIYGQEMKKTN